MHKLTRLLIFLLAPVFLLAQAPTLTLAKATGTITPGGSFTANVVLAGSAASQDSDYQWEFTPATGVTLGAVTVGGAATAAAKTVTCATLNGTATRRCVLTGTNQNNLSDGVLATVSVTLAANLTVGQILALANPMGATVAGAALTTTVGPPPLSFVPCDLNGDGLVDSTDVSSMQDQVLGLAACSSDLNGDGKCTVVDLRRVVNGTVAPGGTGVCRTGP